MRGRPAPGDYLSWNFWDRSFLFASAVSVLWHLLWFFSVTIVVATPAKNKPQATKFVSLGPVMNDTILRTLVETRPEASRAYYRQLSEFESATELPEQMMERQPAGQVTSVPEGRIFSGSLRSLLGGAKLAPEPGADPIPMVGNFFELTGEAANRELLSRPEPPASLLTAKGLVTEISFFINASGTTDGVEVSLSSGDAEVDRVWENYFRQWLFSPLPALGGHSEDRGKISFHVPDEGF